MPRKKRADTNHPPADPRVSMAAWVAHEASKGRFYPNDAAAQRAYNAYLKVQAKTQGVLL